MPRLRPVGRFDLIPPGAERRLAELFERDAAAYGPRDWESGAVSQSEFVNIARDALNRLHARDMSDDWAARAAWAMIGFMYVEAAVRAGVLPAHLADMPSPDPILLGGAVPPLPPSPPLPAFPQLPEK